MERNQINDTICAISTPPGLGGIAVVRVSGPEAIAIVDTLWHGKALTDAKSHSAHLGWLTDPDNGPLDQCIATIYRSPASFTGDDTVELSVHGSTWIQQETLNLLLRHGCRLALPGEFTRRAFAAGHLDLAQAEAVADLIASQSRADHRIAVGQMRGDFSRRLTSLRESLLELASLLELELDFSEEDVTFASRQQLTDLATEIHREITRLTATFSTGQAIRNGIPTAIIGQPNAGKSTLLNLLLDDDRAIVSDIPGTTRDTVEDTTVINGTLFRFIDTAGLRHTTDTIEAIGIKRALDTIKRARIILWLIDAHNPGNLHHTITTITEQLPHDAQLIPVITKTDLADETTITTIADTLHTLLPHNATEIHYIASPTRQGIDHLTETLSNATTNGIASDAVIITNARHYEALTLADADLQRFIQALHSGLPTDLVAQDLRQALHHLGTITGTITTPDILSTIFSRFCIGK